MTNRSTPARRWCRRKPALAASFAAISILLLVVVIGSPIAAFRINEARRHADEQASEASALNEFFIEDLLRQADVWKAEAHSSPNRDVRLLEIVNRAADGIEGKFPGQPLVAAKIHLTVGSVYAGLGETEKAGQHLRAAKGLYETNVGPDDPRTLEVDHALAAWLRANKAEFEETETLLRHVLSVRTKKLGPKHRDTLASMIELAWVRNDRQAHDDAESLFAEAARRAESTVGADASLTLSAREGIASTIWARGLWDRGEWEKAMSLEKEILETRRRVQGAAHPDTLSSLAGTVTMMRERKEDFPAVQGMIDEGLRLSRPIFGERGPTVPLQRQNAVFLTLQGRCAESLALRESLLRNALIDSGPDHLRTLLARRYVGIHHPLFGNEAEALEIFEGVLRAYRLQAPDSRDAQANHRWLARLYWSRGRSQEAITLCVRQTWDKDLLPPWTKPISLFAPISDPDGSKAVLLDGREMAFKAEHGLERHVPEWEALSEGLALLRSREFVQASLEIAKATNAFNLHCRCAALAYAAQAELGLGHSANAQSLLARAESVMIQIRQNQPGDLGRRWFEMAICELAIDQARELMKGEPQGFGPAITTDTPHQP